MRRIPAALLLALFAALLAAPPALAQPTCAPLSELVGLYGAGSARERTALYLIWRCGPWPMDEATDEIVFPVLADTVRKFPLVERQPRPRPSPETYALLLSVFERRQCLPGARDEPNWRMVRNFLDDADCPPPGTLSDANRPHVEDPWPEEIYGQPAGPPAPDRDESLHAAPADEELSGLSFITAAEGAPLLVEPVAGADVLTRLPAGRGVELLARREGWTRVRDVVSRRAGWLRNGLLASD